MFQLRDPRTPQRQAVVTMAQHSLVQECQLLLVVTQSLSLLPKQLQCCLLKSQFGLLLDVLWRQKDTWTAVIKTPSLVLGAFWMAILDVLIDRSMLVSVGLVHERTSRWPGWRPVTSSTKKMVAPGALNVGAFVAMHTRESTIRIWTFWNTARLNSRQQRRCMVRCRSIRFFYGLLLQFQLLLVLDRLLHIQRGRFIVVGLMRGNQGVICRIITYLAHSAMHCDWCHHHLLPKAVGTKKVSINFSGAYCSTTSQ